VRSAATPPPRLSAEARARLLAHPWPGNIRELDNVLGTAAALAGGGTIEPRHLELPAGEPAKAGDYQREIDALRRNLIQTAMTAAGGNRAEAARRLGLTRQALSYHVRKLKL
jgi:DNA-binding NtrC family response regulator